MLITNILTNAKIQFHFYFYGFLIVKYTYSRIFVFKNKKMLFQYPVEEAEKLVEAFENCTLDKSDWSHEAHLLAGMKMCILYGENASTEMKKRVIRFNESVGTINSESSGYHETITHYWITILKAFCRENNIIIFDQYATDTLLFAEELAQRNSFLEYYSKDLIMSSRARMAFVAPDLKEL